MPAPSAAGYSGKPLWQKLGLKPGLRCAIDGAPGDYAALTGFARAELHWPEAGPLDVVHVFVGSRAALAGALDRWQPRLAPTGMLWVSWPKKASGIATDLGEDGIRELALPRGLVDVKVCAVDATWSGLKLVIRKSRRPSA